MPDHDDLGRAERAFTDYFARQAAGIDATGIDPASLTTAGPGPARGRWWAALAAAAMLVVGAAALVPLWGRPPGREVTAVPVAPGDGWVRTPPIPIGQRYGSITVWLDGAFFIVGGTSHCGLDDQGNPMRADDDEKEGSGSRTFCPLSLPSPGERHADGARFDPSTGTWSPIAPAPLVIGTGQGVVVGGDLYVATQGEQEGAAVLRYDPAADTWTELPNPEEQVSRLLAVGEALYAVIGDPTCARCVTSLARWDPAAGSWRNETALPAPPSRAEEFVVSTADSVVVASAEGSAAWRDGTWQVLPALPSDRLRWVGAVSGRIVATAWDEGTAYALDLADPRWRWVEAPSSGQGGLYLGAGQSGVPHFTDGTRATVAGRLYDPVQGSWTDVPRLPNPDWSFGAFAGNGAQVLACFVGPAGSMNDCYTLELAAPTSTAAPVPVEEWAATAASPLGPRTQAIATRVGEEFLVIGGFACGSAPVERRVDGTVTCPTGDLALDGAAYDPATDRWRELADTPVHLDATARWAVLGQTLYAASATAAGLWAYDVPADTWRRLPDPPGDAGRPPQLLAGNGVLLAFARQPGPDAWFDPQAGEWTAFPAGTYPNDAYPGEQERVVVATEKELLVGEPTDTDQGVELVFTVFDVDTDLRLHTVPSATKLESRPGLARAVVDDQGSVVLVPTGDARPAYRVGGGSAWEPVPDAASVGPLAPGLVAGSLVSLQGNLFDTGTGVWRYPSALPGGAATGAVQAAGGDAVLSCYALTGDHLDPGCHLLRL